MIDDDDWEVEAYDDICERYNKDFGTTYPKFYPAGLISIGTKSDPLPLKYVRDNFLNEFTGRYLGEK